VIVIERNTGKKIPCSISGTKITFDDDLSINLAKREQDWPVHIDIYHDVDKELVTGVAVGCAYLAQIDIPKRQYAETTEGSDGEAVAHLVPVPLDIDAVTLTLWSVE
jgi:hypothetical protein